MGALLVHQPRDGAPPAARSLARARAWIEKGKRMPACGEAGTTTRAIVFRASGAAGMAESPRGWLACVGSWHHEEIDPAGDPAPLLDHLETDGPEVLDGLDGMYAVAWYDQRNATLRMATDHLGRLHVFRGESEEGVFLSTSSVAVARAVGADPDPLAVYEFLASGTMYEDRTPFAPVRRLRAARRYRIRKGTVERVVEAAGPDAAQASLEDVHEACEQAVARCGRVHERPLADLTGGLDSRIVVGYLWKAGGAREVTVTGHPRDPDVYRARQLARSLGANLVRQPTAALEEDRASLPCVLRAAAFTEGGFDAIEYAGIARIHGEHAERWNASINGSGGEMLRNYWWGAAEIGSKAGDPVALALPRFARPSLIPTVLLPEHVRDPRLHFREVLSRSLAGWNEAPLTARLDHLYLDLRMQCWQGSIASATNQIWPALSPLLHRRVLRAALATDPRLRLGHRLIHALLSRLPDCFSTTPVVSGFPPLRPSLRSWWRFVPGTLRAPVHLWPRVLGRLGLRRKTDPRIARSVQALLDGGARDYLDPGSMRLLPLLDRGAFGRFLDAGRATGRIARPLLGRLLALEFAYRSASTPAED